jgi:hypothetical protein
VVYFLPQLTHTFFNCGVLLLDLGVCEAAAGSARFLGGLRERVSSSEESSSSSSSSSAHHLHGNRPDHRVRERARGAVLRQRMVRQRTAGPRLTQRDVQAHPLTRASPGCIATLLSV